MMIPNTFFFRVDSAAAHAVVRYQHSISVLTKTMPLSLIKDELDEDYDGAVGRRAGGDPRRPHHQHRSLRQQPPQQQQQQQKHVFFLK